MIPFRGNFLYDRLNIHRNHSSIRTRRGIRNTYRAACLFIESSWSSPANDGIVVAPLIHGMEAADQQRPSDSLSPHILSYPCWAKIILHGGVKAGKAHHFLFIYSNIAPFMNQTHFTFIRPLFRKMILHKLENGGFIQTKSALNGDSLPAQAFLLFQIQFYIIELYQHIAHDHFLLSKTAVWQCQTAV